MGATTHINGDPDISFLKTDAAHLNYIFPEDSDETVTLTAGGTNNVFGAWAEIADDQAVTLSSKATSVLHISSIIIESASVKDKVYVLEVSYGSAKTTVVRVRGISATTLISHTGQDRMRNLEIPSGETIYYRLKCETAEATITVHFRYHYH